MSKREFILVIALSLGLGVSVVVALSGPRISAQGASPAPMSTGRAGSTVTLPLAANTPAETLLPPIPILIPVEVGNQKGMDLEDVLLLYDSAHVSNFDINFCKLAGYYGLLCKRLALDTAELTDGLLRDGQGAYFKLIGVSAAILLQNPSLLGKEETALLRSAIESVGVNLLVADVGERSGAAFVADLTQGAVLGAARPQDSHRDWIVSSESPEVTREFTGQVITSTSTATQGDFALTLGQPTSITMLISSQDDAGTAYPIFVRWKAGAGSIFVDAGETGKSLEELRLREMYYSPDHFSQIIPLMLTLRYALEEEAWHSNHRYANLTIDDPALTEPFINLNYADLLGEMKAHDFHTTIAFIPARFEQTQQEVVNLFVASPNRYSLAQHGNNHDGYEFYKYQVTEDDLLKGKDYQARPLADQEWDILEGLARLGMHHRLTGIPFGKVMIFPYGISPEPTLVLLKKHNYLATVNAQDYVLDANFPADWDYGMYPAIMNYGNFAMLTRREPGKYQPFRPDAQPSIFDLFIGKAALFFTHAYAGELFDSGIDAFDPVADEINQVPGGVEWRSLGEIIKHLYLEKTNDDGSIDIKMYGNDLIFAPVRPGVTYHVIKEEMLNVPIKWLTVNGQEFPYRVEQGLLKLDLVTPADAPPMEVVIHYGD